jgi:hypothetical protein
MSSLRIVKISRCETIESKRIIFISQLNTGFYLEIVYEILHIFVNIPLPGTFLFD